MTSPDAAVIRGLVLLLRHLEEDGHAWTDSEMGDVNAACNWIDALQDNR